MDEMTTVVSPLKFASGYSFTSMVNAMLSDATLYEDMRFDTAAKISTREHEQRQSWWSRGRFAPPCLTSSHPRLDCSRCFFSARFCRSVRPLSRVSLLLPLKKSHEN